MPAELHERPWQGQDVLATIFACGETQPATFAYRTGISSAGSRATFRPIPACCMPAGAGAAIPRSLKTVIYGRIQGQHLPEKPVKLSNASAARGRI